MQYRRLFLARSWPLLGLLLSCGEPARPAPRFWPESQATDGGADTALPIALPDAARPEAPLVPPRRLDAAATVDRPPDLPPDLPIRLEARPPSDGPPVGATCRLQVEVRTETSDTGYAPRNIGAIWVADGADRFVKTLKRWAVRRVVHLTQWNEVTAAAGARRDVTDAVTGATERAHKAHVVAWTCGDNKGVRRRQDVHRIYFEMTETNSEFDDEPSLVHVVEVTLGPEPYEMKLPDAEYFKDIKVIYKP